MAWSPRTQKASTDVRAAIQAVFMNSDKIRLLFDAMPAAAAGRPVEFIGICRTALAFPSDGRMDPADAKAIKPFLVKAIDSVKRGNAAAFVVCQGSVGVGATHCLAYVLSHDDTQQHLSLESFDAGMNEVEANAANVFNLLRKRTKGTIIHAYHRLPLQCSNDTFCQTWSLMALVKYKEHGSFAFLRGWRANFVGDTNIIKDRAWSHITSFILEHISSADFEHGNYKFHLLFNVADTLHRQFGLDVYWDEYNLQSIIPLAMVGLRVNVPANMLQLDESMMVFTTLTRANRRRDLAKWPHAGLGAPPVNKYTLISKVDEPTTKKRRRAVRTAQRPVTKRRRAVLTAPRPAAKRRRTAPRRSVAHYPATASGDDGDSDVDMSGEAGSDD